MVTEREILEAVDDDGFECQSGKDAGFAESYAIADLLNRRGYFLDFRPHPASSMDDGPVNFVSIAHLSLHGRARLHELRFTNGQGER